MQRHSDGCMPGQKSQFFMSRRSKLSTGFRAVLLCSLTAWMAAACGDSDSRNTPDVSNIQVPVKVQRFETDLFALDTNNVAAGMAALQQKYPVFLPFFLSQVVQDPTHPGETPEQALAGFLKAAQVRRLYDSCRTRYADLAWLTPELDRMFRYYKYYFPEKTTPTVVTTITELVGDAYPVNDTLLMLSLDYFMGENFSAYNPDYFPEYLRRQFKQEYVPIKLATALANGVVGPPKGDKVADFMLNNGKILYIVDCLLPTLPDSMKMGYTREQMEGCYANEAEVWARLLDLQVLYTPVNDKNQKIVMPSPSAEIVFPQAPGEIGNWVGWQIVKAYMKRNPDTTMEQLLKQTDPQKFLEQAKYKPKRS
ncbi:MAG: hypothetical protein JNM22_23340 [Saprospiraceae bacterium]|nr:hypothetical protein [Saprospiraceae bacterium]